MTPVRTTQGAIPAGPLALLVAIAVMAAPARGEGPLVKYGDPVPRDVREIYDTGLRYLLKTQDASGSWKSSHGTPAPTAMALMVLLASGEDPNYGPYRGPVRRAVRAIINDQDGGVGFIGGGNNPSMYHHGFAMLGLAEAYGAVDDRDLWTEPGAQGGQGKGRSIGRGLELAVQAAVTSNKKNPTGGWHYGPEMTSADTSVSGAVLMGLLAARNAGIEVPDETIDRAIKYYVTMTGGNGNVGYSGPGSGTEATTSIGVLVFSIARRQALPQYKSARDFLERSSAGGAVAAGPGPAMGIRSQGSAYEHYYRAQALFQCNVEAWEKWNAGLVKVLKRQQAKDGSFTMSYGADIDTPMTLLALAVNYKLLPVYER